MTISTLSAASVVARPYPPSFTPVALPSSRAQVVVASAAVVAIAAAANAWAHDAAAKQAKGRARNWAHGTRPPRGTPS